MAEDTAGLLGALGLSRAHVAGHSMGGQIAQELALAHPEQVITLTLLSSCARVDERGKAVRGAELIVLDKPGHGLLIESPEATAGAMLDFLSRNI